MPNSSTGARKGHRIITGNPLRWGMFRVRHELKRADETKYVQISSGSPGLRGLAGVAGGGVWLWFGAFADCDADASLVDYAVRPGL